MHRSGYPGGGGDDFNGRSRSRGYDDDRQGGYRGGRGGNDRGRGGDRGGDRGRGGGGGYGGGYDKGPTVYEGARGGE